MWSTWSLLAVALVGLTLQAVAVLEVYLLDFLV
jgi:hypothetical protein